MFDRSLSCRGSLGKSLGTVPSYNGMWMQRTLEHMAQSALDRARDCVRHVNELISWKQESLAANSFHFVWERHLRRMSIRLSEKVEFKQLHKIG